MTGKLESAQPRIAMCSALAALLACSCSSPATKEDPKVIVRAADTGTGGGAAAANTGHSGTGGGAPGTGGKGAPAVAGMNGGSGSGGAKANPGTGGAPATGGSGAGGAGGPTMMMPFDGPLDGDPNKPMVEIPEVKCGVPNIGFGGSPPAVKIGGRDVVVAYPCAHEGAAVTFFIFLHGTLMDDAQKIPFTMNAWPIHKLVDSHNIIVVAPKAIGSQWGREDDGKDLPHLYEVVDWVYNTFGEKFSIRSMWAQGGSWGAFYLGTTFACDPKFETRLKGVQMIVGGGCPACSSRLSCMVGQQELEKGMGNPVSADMKEMLSSGAQIDTYATMHGCDGKTAPMPVGNTTSWYWPNCDKGWTHSYYLGPGNHADAWDPAAVLKTTDDIKATEN